MRVFWADDLATRVVFSWIMDRHCTWIGTRYIVGGLAIGGVKG